MHRTVTDLTDDELEIHIERFTREQKRRETVALRAISKQSALFLPSRLYAGTR